MYKIRNTKPIYDLEERTLQFAKRVRIFVKTLPNTLANIENSKQLIKSSGSVGANYREANEALSKKDFLMRIKISRKVAKESVYWLRLINETNELNNKDDTERLLSGGERIEKDLFCDSREIKIITIVMLLDEWAQFVLVIEYCNLNIIWNLEIVI